MNNNLSGSQTPPALKLRAGSTLLPTLVAVAISISLGAFTTSTLANTNPFAVESEIPNIQSRADGDVSSDSVVPNEDLTDAGYDADYVPNEIDLDDDNDSILDTEEGLIDENGDGIPDANSRDTDGDGVPDGLDLDSDNDGILDIIEGRLPYAQVLILDDLDKGNISPNHAVGVNGIADIIETSADSNVVSLPLLDTDNDGIPNYLDIDSDNDGIADLVEAGGQDGDFNGRVDNFEDIHNKGIDDRLQANALPLFDTDNDGLLDYLDLDSDQDSISDFTESGGQNAAPTDTDQDGAADYRETDSDGDGVTDTVEAGANPLIPLDTDSDGIWDYQDASIQSGTDGNPDSTPSGYDADYIPNSIDLDDDNDSILDTEEGLIDENGDGIPDANSRDSDGDGIPDGLDLDSDNDGILDIIEGRLPYEQARILNDLGKGNISPNYPVGVNGIADAIETSVDSNVIALPLLDTDNDGVPNYIDTDSDNDGIFDLVEAGGEDDDFNGRVDNFEDMDDKGIDDRLQANALPLFDTDNDGVLDYLDLDSDQDTIPDEVESGGDFASPTDTDQDGAADYRETDSDGDGVGDQVEAGGNTQSPLDSNADGTPDFQDPNVVTDANPGTDSNPQNDDPLVSGYDADFIPNSIDLDDDNDSILDTEEGLIDENGDGIPDANSRDSDGDGVPDGLDLDSDNDGILDLIEARLPYDQAQLLNDMGKGNISPNHAVGVNGIADVIETFVDSNVINLPLLDTDGDGIPNYLDIDSDNDGIADIVEAGGQDENFDGRVDNFEDVDSKGIDDKLQADALPLFDTDNDGVLDYLDLDSDQDSIPDEVESGGSFVWPTDTDQDGAADYRETDSDNDGVSDTVEAGANPLAPLDSNGDNLWDYQDASVQGGDGTPIPTVPGTDDNDNDGIINSDDDDDDNDGISDVIEGTGDNDSDGVANYLDHDSDNDGVFDSRETATDTDGDTIPDYLDLDSDNDGIYDALEAGRDSIANTGRLASAATVDENGLAQGSSDFQLDTDNDGVVDMLDLDSDNDSLLDVLEAGFPSADVAGRIEPFTDSNGDGADDSIVNRGTTLRDTDGDRIPDIRDLDSDQDGLSDLLEMSGPALDQDNSGQVDNFIDANSDGLDDNVAANPTPQTDTDNDRNPNSTDLDSDNDGISDLNEAGGVDTNGDDRVDIMGDADLDGIPDQNDTDVTQGADLDSDGIDDTDDIDFVAGPDSDGDGIVDSQDPDSDGNGFAGPLDDATTDVLSQGTPVNLPDTDGDGIADINQGLALDGIIETGLGGSGFGCSIASIGNMSKPDPMLGLLLGGSMMFLGLRLRRRPITKIAVIASTAVVSGCSTIGLDMDLGSFAPDPDVEKRIYVGAGVLMSQLEPNTDQVAGTSVSESQSSGMSGTVGYDFANRFSVEGHYAELGEAELAPAGTVGYSVAGVSALYYGMNDSFDRSRRTGLSAYGRLGLGMLENDVTVVDHRRLNDLHLLAGVGLEYGLDNGLAVRGEVTAHETDAKYAQLGLIYRFNGSGGYRTAPAVDTLPEMVAIDREPVLAPVPAPVPQPKLPLDTDGDGIADLTDNCLGTATGLPVKSDGCAIFDGVIEGINFETNSDRLTPDSMVVLEDVADTLEEFPDVRVTIEAHTDNMGSAASNLQLSKRRAIAVARFLVDEGISGSRLKPQAFGESMPRTSNASKTGRASNRRVEISVL